MNEDFCSYELSKALKAAGFDEPCHYHYDCDRGSHIIEPNYTTNDGEGCQYITADDLLEDSNGWQYCSAPTLAHAQKWLREKRGYIVAIHPEGEFLRAERTYKHTGWNYSIIRIDKNDFMAPGPIGKVLIAKYEQALAKGIAHTLELIQEGE